MILLLGSKANSHAVSEQKSIDYYRNQRTSDPVARLRLFALSKLMVRPVPLFIDNFILQFVCVEVLRPSQPNGVMSSAVSLPNHTFTGQA